MYKCMYQCICRRDWILGISVLNSFEMILCPFVSTTYAYAYITYIHTYTVYTYTLISMLPHVTPTNYLLSKAILRNVIAKIFKISVGKKMLTVILNGIPEPFRH